MEQLIKPKLYVNPMIDVALSIVKDKATYQKYIVITSSSLCVFESH